MKRFGSFAFAIFTIVCLLSITERRAWGYSGYVDPGSGLLALQCIMSVLAAAGYYMRRRIHALFGSKKNEKNLPDVSATPEGPRKAA